MKKQLLLIVGMCFALMSSQAQNNALSFDGVDDNVAISTNLTNLSSFTIEAWINPVSIPASGNMAILNTNSWTTTDGGSVHFQTEGGKIILSVDGLSNTDGWPTLDYTPELNKWQHITVTYDVASLNVKFYVNGALLNTVNYVSMPTAKIDAAEIGAWNTSRYFNGAIDEVRIWNVARTSTEIANIYNTEISSPATTTGLVAYYNCNQGIAGDDNSAITQLTDGSASAVNGTLNGFAKTGTTSNFVAGPFLPILAVSSNTVSLTTANSYSATIDVTSNTTWTAVSSANWLTVSPSLATTGSATLSFSASPIAFTASRTATVTLSADGVTSQVINVSQPGWKYSEILNITENSGVNLTNYQLKITLNTEELITAGKLQADGADLRFAADANYAYSYSYWIESGINTTNTVIWVKINSLPANATQELYYFYGNNDAVSESSIPNTFNAVQSADKQMTDKYPGGLPNSIRGYRFSPNEDILVTQFGKYEPNGTTRYITLFDFQSQNKLEQIQVAGAADTYCYADISNPTWLTKDKQYLLTIYQGAADGYYYTGISATSMNSYITYYDTRFTNSGDQNTFPNNILSNMLYGYPDFKFYTKTTVSPEPSYSSNIATSIGDEDTTTKLFVYPNPASEMIHLSSTEGISKIQITNLLGSVVWSGSAADFPINVTSFTKGIYLVNMVTVNGMKTEKVIIKH